METNQTDVGAPAAGSSNGHHLGDLALALSKAQAAFPKLVKDQTASVLSQRTGKEYSYRYSDLASLFEAIRKPLSDNGLALVQLIDISPSGSHYILTQLLHVSGAKLESRMLLADHEKPQELGSEITYKRRYALSAMVGIASEVDDDGAAAQVAPVRAVPGYYRGKPPASEEQVKYGNPEVLKTISEELLPNTDEREFLEGAIPRKCKAHAMAQTEMLALGLHFLGKGKNLKTADAASLNKFYQFLQDPQAVGDWRLEFKRKMAAASPELGEAK